MRENLDSDFEESHFFLFRNSYPGYHFACLEKLKRPKIPMLFYNDHIPYLELCKVNITGDHADIDSNVQTTRNECATKMLILFYPFRDRANFPIFEERWTFFARLKIMDFFSGMQQESCKTYKT